MATLDLSLVSLSLTSLLKKNIERLSVLDLSPMTVDVTIEPPEQVQPARETVNFYLYHVCEDPHFKNQIGLPGADPKVSGQCLALKLYYILTTHVPESLTDFEAKKQSLFGWALKTLHDFPIINDELEISSQQVILDDLKGAGNFIETSLRPLEPEDALNFWAAEDQKTPRLSAFYEVRTVLFSPEKPKSSSSRVFDVGLYVESSSPAKILSSHTKMQVTPPSVFGLPDQVLDLSPARTTLQTSGSPSLFPVRIKGHNLLSGDRQNIFIKKSGWPSPLLLDPSLIQNQNWKLELKHDEIMLTFQAALSHGTGPTVETITPGFYEVGLEIENDRQLGTQIISSSHSAGKTIIAVGGHIDDDDDILAVPAAHAAVINNDSLPLIRINLVNVLTNLETLNDITLFVGGEYYAKTDDLLSIAADPLTDPTGSFMAIDNVVYFKPFFDPTVAGVYPVQLVINGIESQPYWLER